MKLFVSLVSAIGFGHSRNSVKPIKLSSHVGVTRFDPLWNPAIRES
jgi:hypothetical protein